jgi:hypothetical protein
MPPALPVTDPLISVPPITDPAAAIQQPVEFFDKRQMLMRGDFLQKPQDQAELFANFNSCLSQML